MTPAHESILPHYLRTAQEPSMRLRVGSFAADVAHVTEPHAHPELRNVVDAWCRATEGVSALLRVIRRSAADIERASSGVVRAFGNLGVSVVRAVLPRRGHEKLAAKARVPRAAKACATIAASAPRLEARAAL